MKKIVFIFLMLTQCLLAQRVGKPLGEFFGVYMAPLQIGNSWNYRDSYWNPAFKVEIIDTVVMNNGLKYFKSLERRIDGTNLIRFLRLREDGYYAAFGGNPFLETEYFYYKNNAQIGDFWVHTRNAYSDKVYHIIRNSSSLPSFWGTFIPVKIIDIKDSILTWYREYWSDEFGLVRQHRDEYWTPGLYFLWGCVINGTKYGDTTLVSVEDQPLINPTDFVLYQNYPNPFNAVTIIQYKVPITSFVKIKVYDMLGKEIAVLVSEEKPLGNYFVEFNAEELKSLTLTSGTYFYELTVNGKRKVKKMALLK